MTIELYIRFELSTDSCLGEGQWCLFDVTKCMETVTDVVTFSITATRVFVAYNFAVILSRFRGITSNKIDAGSLRIVQRHAASPHRKLGESGLVACRCSQQDGLKTVTLLRKTRAEVDCYRMRLERMKPEKGTDLSIHKGSGGGD
jgi:hypothetical protein